MDINCLSYLALIGMLLIFFHKTVVNWTFHTLIHVLFIISILQIVRLGEMYSHSKTLWILRSFYPLIVILYGWSERKLGYVLLPMTVGVAVSTIYLGYHHALDPIFGFIWGTISYLIALKLIKKREEDSA